MQYRGRSRNTRCAWDLYILREFWPPICPISVMRLVRSFIPTFSRFSLFVDIFFPFFLLFFSLFLSFGPYAPIRASPRHSPPRRVRLPFKFISPFTIPSLFLFRPLLDPCHLFDEVGCSSRPSLHLSLVHFIVRTCTSLPGNSRRSWFALNLRGVLGMVTYLCFLFHSELEGIRCMENNYDSF